MSNKKTALITGVTGQTGSYLAELLLEKGYDVHGIVRRSSSFNTGRIDHIFSDLKLHYGDLSDYGSLVKVVQKTQPELVFNTGAMSHVRVSFDIPEYTMDVSGTGVMRMLEALREFSPYSRFVHSSTTELFGKTEPPHNEESPFYPRSPYAVAKIAGYWATVNYREAYDMHASNTISSNHEGVRRGETFVTRKITRAATRIKLGLQEKVMLGNLDAKRDWLDARDVARAQYMVATADQPNDYVVGAGESRSVKEFLEIVFKKLDLDIEQHVGFDPKYLRPSEVEHLCTDPSKIKRELGWEPEISFDQMVEDMIENDLRLAENEKKLKV